MKEECFEYIEEIILRLKSAVYDANRMTTGNIAHLKPQIIGHIEIAIKKLEKLEIEE